MAGLAPGSEVGRYRLGGTLRVGELGALFDATDLGWGESVMVRALQPWLSGEPGYVEHFERELTKARDIVHDRILPVLGSGLHGDQLYVLLPPRFGTDIRQLDVSTRARRDVCARVIADVAEALEQFHRCGLVCRALLPEHVVVEGGRAWLCGDVGAVNVFARPEPPGPGPHPGRVVATLPESLCPEVIKGWPVDPRSHVYVLGGFLYRALTGRYPFVRDNDLATMSAHLTEEPPALAELAPQVPAALEDVVRRALAKDPDERYQSAAEFGQAVLAAAGAPPAVTL